MADATLRDPERRLACLYAPVDRRAGLEALWLLDEQLADLLRGAHDPMVGQLRFTWWHEALTRLDDRPPPAQPLLQMLSAQALSHGVTGAALAAMIDGWEILLDQGPLDDAAILIHAEARGGRLFALAGALLGASPGDPVTAAGQGWGLVDLGFHLSDPAARARCFALAAPALRSIEAVKWSVAARPLGMLARLAAIDARHGHGHHRRQGSPQRLLRMLQHRVTGR